MSLQIPPISNGGPSQGPDHVSHSHNVGKHGQHMVNTDVGNKRKTFAKRKPIRKVSGKNKKRTDQAQSVESFEEVGIVECVQDETITDLLSKEDSEAQAYFQRQSAIEDVQRSQIEDAEDDFQVQLALKEFPGFESVSTEEINKITETAQSVLENKIEQTDDGLHIETRQRIDRIERLITLAVKNYETMVLNNRKRLIDSE